MIITFVSAVQLLWIKVIMDTFAALALTTNPASESKISTRQEARYPQNATFH